MEQTKVDASVLVASVRHVKARLFKKHLNDRGLKKSYKIVYNLTPKEIVLHYIQIEKKESWLPSKTRKLIVSIVRQAVNRFNIKQPNND